jgi:3-oxoacyl-[acyl-carrier protein] reductase
VTIPLAGRLAVVTGVTRGIGAAIAMRLHADGARVIGTGTKPNGTAPEGCEYRSVDFRDVAATEAFADSLAHDRPDILVNNAGTNRNAPFESIETSDFEALHRINVVAPLILCRAVLPSMRRKRWGRVVNICSIWSKVSRPGRASYSASKFGLDGMTAALAAEVAADGVLVNAVSPGFTDTELTRRTVSPEAIAALVSEVPARRLARPDEIAAFIAWLVGPENTYISGQNIAIDGGFTRV